ncbi:hypothetical protein [Hydrotalea sp.]|uniref:hypothetical protein n=1 Tax=Hydrotalea sp. TaxID=2881279 RepID=UPI0025853BE3|nr:hypothetical protein [Hydrotalea sp.]
MKNKHIYIAIALLFLIGCMNNEKHVEESNNTIETGDTAIHIKSRPNYTAIGKKIAAEAQLVLARNLADAINKGGVAYAIQFCNTQAYPITDSMSKILNAELKRVSDKN